MGDDALAVPQKLHDVLHRKAMRIEHHAVACIDVLQHAHEGYGLHGQKVRDMIQILGQIYVGQLGMLVVVKPLGQDGVRINLLKDVPLHGLIRVQGALFVVELFKALFYQGAVHGVHVFCQALLVGMAAPHVVQKVVHADGRKIQAYLLYMEGPALFIPDIDALQDHFAPEGYDFPAPGP